MTRLTKIYSLTSVLGEWVIDPKAISIAHESLANPVVNFVLGHATGDPMDPTADSLRQSLSLQSSIMGSPSKADGRIPLAIWIAVSKRSIRSQVDFTGEKIAKIDMTEGEEVHSAYLVNKQGELQVKSVKAETIANPQNQAIKS